MKMAACSYCMAGRSLDGAFDMLELISQQRHLRSTTSCSLFVLPITRYSTFAERSFSVYGLKMWNTLPTQIRNAISLTLFKTLLKAHLFQQAY